MRQLVIEKEIVNYDDYFNEARHSARYRSQIYVYIDIQIEELRQVVIDKEMANYDDYFDEAVHV